MDLSFSEDQRALRDTLRTFLERECPLERVREAEPLGHDHDLWRGLLDLGVIDLAVTGTERGENLLELSLLAEVHGAHLAPTPFAEVAVASRVLAASAGTDAVLKDITAGGRIVALALHRGHGRHLGLVPAGAITESVIAMHFDRLVLARTKRQKGSHARNLGCLPLGDLSIEAIDLELFTTAEATDVFTRALDEWRVLTAAMLDGLARRALEITLRYVKEREQFGVSIGSFQAVQHRLADIATAIDGAQLLTREAAWAGGVRQEGQALLAAMAIAQSTEVSRSATATGLHLHGGYGFATEFDIQLFFRRAKAWPLVLSDPSLQDILVTERLAGKL